MFESRFLVARGRFELEVEYTDENGATFLVRDPKAHGLRRRLSWQDP